MSKLIFLSYSHHDEKLADEIDQRLTMAVGTHCFKAKADTKEHSKWRDAIFEGLKTCKVAVILVTPNSRASDWVHFEAGLCQGHGLKVFPICFQENGSESPENLRVLRESTHLMWPREASTLLSKIEEHLKSVGAEFHPRKESIPDSLENVDFGPQDECKLIQMLWESRPLGKRHALKRKYSQHEIYDIAPILVESFIDEYCEALEAAVRGRPIDLSTRHRIKVAEQMIKKAADFVNAVSYVQNDPWLTNDPDRDDYILTNCNTGQKLYAKRESKGDENKFKRIFVFQDEKAARRVPPRLLATMHKMQVHHIDLFWITEEGAKSSLQQAGHPRIENLLLVDARWMTKSSGVGHDGQYVAKSSWHCNGDTEASKIINKNVEAFECLEKAALLIPCPAPSNLMVRRRK